MTSSLQKYQSLVDALVKRKDCVLARRVRNGDLWLETANKAKYNNLIKTLSEEQRVQVSELLQDAREGGIHDTLMVISEKMNLEDLKLVQGGEELPHEPYGTEIYYDWVCRAAGDDWPLNHE